MLNQSITVDTLAAWACWLGGTILAVGDMFAFMPDDSGFVGVIAVAFGHLITVTKLHQRMESRELAAFQLGRKSGLRAMEKV